MFQKNHDSWNRCSTIKALTWISCRNESSNSCLVVLNNLLVWFPPIWSRLQTHQLTATQRENTDIRGIEHFVYHVFLNLLLNPDPVISNLHVTHTILLSNRPIMKFYQCLILSIVNLINAHFAQIMKEPRC